jgi:hypothetical protein
MSQNLSRNCSTAATASAVASHDITGPKRSQESVMRFLRFDTEAWAALVADRLQQGTIYLPRILLTYAGASTVTQPISSASPSCLSDATFV